MNIYEFVQEKVTAYPTTEITLHGHKQFNQYELINTIDSYRASLYTSGQYDDIGRRKPFQNEMNRILNKQQTAEEVDTKDISLETTRPHHYVKSFTMTLANRYWMKKANFAKTLNKMVEVRGAYGGVLIKKVMRDDVLNIDVANWSHIVTDPADINSGIKIEPFELSPAELMKKKEEGWGVGEFEGSIEDAIMLAEANQDDERNQKKTMTDYVTVYTVHGVLPRVYMDDEASMFDYSEQTHIVVLGGETDDGEEAGVTLFAAEDVEHPYKYLTYKDYPGRGLGQGKGEESIEPQISINEMAIAEKNAMEIAGKPIFQADTDTVNVLKNRNLITGVRDGTVLEHGGQPISLLNSTPNSIGQFANIITRYKQALDGQTSTLDVNTGNMPASATFRGQALQNQEANSLFELRREEMGIFLQEVYRDWVIPYLKTMLRDEEFITAKLSPEELQMVQKDYVQKMADKKINERLLNGEYDEMPAETKWIQINNDREQTVLLITDELKGKNFIKSPKGYLDDVEFDLDIIITNEQRIKQVFLEIQVDALQTYLQNREAINTDPNARSMVAQIFETVGLPPLESNPEQQEVSPLGQQELVGGSPASQLEGNSVV